MHICNWPRVSIDYNAMIIAYWSWLWGRWRCESSVWKLMSRCHCAADETSISIWLLRSLKIQKILKDWSKVPAIETLTMNIQNDSIEDIENLHWERLPINPLSPLTTSRNLVLFWSFNSWKSQVLYTSMYIYDTNLNISITVSLNIVHSRISISC